jgi:hypothetical protein
MEISNTIFNCFPSQIAGNNVTVTAGEGMKILNLPKWAGLTLRLDKVKQIPAFMGEVDILKALQFLPGVRNAGEGNTGLYVRGGGADQN